MYQLLVRINSELHKRIQHLPFYDQKGINALISYGTSQGLMAFIKIASFSIVIAQLSLAEFGFLSATQITALIFGVVTCLGVNTIGTPRLYVDPSFDRTTIFRSGFTFITLNVVTLSTLAFLLTGQVAALLAISQYQAPLLIIILTSLLQQYVNLGSEVFRIEEKAHFVGAINTLPRITELGLTVIAFLLIKDKLLAVAIARLVNQIGTVVVIGIAFRKQLGFTTKLIREIVSLSWPVAFHRTIQQVNLEGDKVFAAAFLGLEIAGAYAFASRIADLFQTIASPFQQTWTPLILRLYLSGHYARISQLTTYFVYVTIALFTLFFFLNHFIAPLLDTAEKYSASYHLINLIMFGGLLESFAKVFSIGFLLERRLTLLFPISLLCLALNASFIFLTIHEMGVYSLIIGVALANTLFLVLTGWKSHDYFPLESRKPYLVAGASLGLAAIMILVSIELI